MPGEGQRGQGRRHLPPRPAGRGSEASTPSRGSQPSAPRTAATAPPGAASARRCRARPSPEKPRQTSGLSTSVNRAPGTSSCQPVLPSVAQRTPGAPSRGARPVSKRRRRPSPARPAAPAPGSWWSRRRSAARGREPHGRLRRRLRDRPEEGSCAGGFQLRERASSACITWTSRKPRSHRDGSGTRRSTAEPPSVSTSTADAPTDRPSSTPAPPPQRGRHGSPARSPRSSCPPQDLAVIRVGQQVDPAVDAAAGRERLEPETVVGTRRDRVGELQDALEHLRRHVEARTRHVAEREQQVGRHDRPQQSTLKNWGLARATGRRKPEPTSIAVRRRAPTAAGSDTSARGLVPREPSPLCITRLGPNRVPRWRLRFDGYICSMTSVPFLSLRLRMASYASRERWICRRLTSGMISTSTTTTAPVQSAKPNV